MVRYDIIVDGSSKGNPGPSGVGFKVFQDKTEIYSQSEPLDEGTNNEAEYHAVIKATNWMNAQFRGKIYPMGEVIVYTDSKTVFNQVTGKWKVDKIHLVNLYLKAKEALRTCNAKLQWTRNTVQKKYGVDALAKNAATMSRMNIQRQQ